MAKKQRSAKQKAATRKLVAFNKRKSTPKRRKSSRKVNKPRKSRSNVAKKRRAPSRGRQVAGGLVNKIPILKNKTVQQIGLALGMARIASTAARVVPIPIIQNNSQLIGTGIAFSVSPLGGIVDLALSGGLGQISSLFGGGGGTNGTVNTGFA